MRTATALLLAILLTGCATTEPAEPNRDAAETRPDGSIDHDAVAQAIGAPIVDLAEAHDHNDAFLHRASHNVEFIAWSHLGITLGQNGFANFVLWDDGRPGGERLALVAVDGDVEGGFVIADVADPLDIKVLGTGWKSGNNIQEVRITPDGRFAFTNIQTIANLPDALGPPCPVCLVTWNIEDRSAPRVVGVTPVELAGTHNLHVEQHGTEVYVHYVGQPLAAVGPADPGNHVWVGRFVESPDGSATVVPVSQYEHDRSGDTGRTFPHDVMVQDHPITGQKIAYVSHWDGGHVTFDVTDPLMPVELDIFAERAPSDALAVHWMWQEEWVRADGRVIAWSAPEIGSLDGGTGVIRALDVTDPAAMSQVGWWELPGNLSIENRYILSPHTVFVDRETGLAAVSHYHAGVWILDVSAPEAPRHVGFYQPHGDPAAPYNGTLWWKKPNFSPAGYGPNVYQVRWDDRGDETLLWVSDRGTGLYALRYTGPIAGPLG